MKRFSGLADAAECARWRALVEGGLAAALRPTIDTAPAAIVLGSDGAASPSPHWPCSLRLDSLPSVFDELIAAVRRHAPLHATLHARLGPELALLSEHCWVRHQPPPHRRGPAQHPHSWHQDGALAFDFTAAPPPYPADAVLPMLTCWIPLAPCGADAPSLAWFEPPLNQLLAPAELQDGIVSARFAGREVLPRHAVLREGDALLFEGGLVHRTHATAGMTRHRTSVELRWLPGHAVPARLARGRILTFD